MKYFESRVLACAGQNEEGAKTDLYEIIWKTLGPCACKRF